MRRPFSLSTLFAVWALLVVGLPLWWVLGTLVGVFRRRRMVGLRLMIFLLIFTTMEVVGVLAMGLAFLVGRANDQPFHHALQAWWAGSLFKVMKVVLSLRFDVSGDDVLANGPYLLLMRHASLADTLLPAALVSVRHKKRLRYVLKRELRADPCLDICGGRLPNHFVDRTSPDGSELDAIAALARDLGPDEGVLIYPEGTRFSEGKRARRLQALKDRGAALLEQARALKSTLAPRIRGVAALRAAAPHVDVVICAHHGFEGFRTLGDVLSGGMVGRTVCVRFWRIPAAELPSSEALLPWLYDEWAEVDRFVRAHAA